MVRGLSNIYSAWVKLKTKLEFAAHCFYWYNIDTRGEYDRERFCDGGISLVGRWINLGLARKLSKK